MSISSFKLIVMKAKLFFVTPILLSVLFSCNRNTPEVKKDVLLSELKTAPGSLNTDEEQVPVTVDSQVVAQQTAEPDPQKKQVKNITPATVDWDKKIIKTASLRLEVKDFNSYSDKVRKTVKQFGGYIAQEEQNLSEEKTETIMSVKVPVAQFEDLMNGLPNTDSKILERKITSEDVTGQVVDTKSRLEAKKQMRLKYLDFLKQSKNMEEVLQVQGEINSIQEEIEAAAGRISYLTNQSAYSTINLSFYQPLAGYKPADEKPGFGSRIAASFKTGASWIAELFIGLVTLWPLILSVTTVWFLWKRFKPSVKKSSISV